MPATRAHPWWHTPRMQADIFIKCFPKWNTDWLPADLLDGGKVKVNEFAQSPAHGNVFSVGCCTNTKVCVDDTPTT